MRLTTASSVKNYFKNTPTTTQEAPNAKTIRDIFNEGVRVTYAYMLGILLYLFST